MVAEVEAAAETVVVGTAPVELAAETGVDCQLFQRQAVEAGEQGETLLFGQKTEAHLQRQAAAESVKLREDAFEKMHDLVRSGQHRRASPLLYHLRGRTAEVPVEVSPACLPQSSAQPEKGLPLVVEELGNQRRALRVVCRQDIFEHLIRKCRTALRRNKRRQYTVPAGERGKECCAVDAVGNSPQRGKDEARLRVLLWRHRIVFERGGPGGKMCKIC